MYTTVDGEGGGAHVTPLAVTDGGGGLIVLSATSAMPGSFVVPMVIHYEMCDGTSLTTMSNRTVYEQIPAVSGYLQLTPLAGNPNRYAGSRVILRSETPRNGGSEVIEWVMSWEITRNRR